jgi:hypothetical protein
MNDCSNAEIRDLLPELLHERLEASARATIEAHVMTCVDCRDELQLLRDVFGMLDSQTPMLDVARIAAALPKPPILVLLPAEVELIDGARIAPAASASVAGVTPLSSRRRVWADWRVAAAVTLLVAGGSSAALIKHESAAVSPTSAVAVSAGSSGATRGADASANASTTAGTVTGTASIHAVASAGSTSVASTSSTASAAKTPGAATAGDQQSVGGVEDHAGADLGNGSRLGDLSEAQLQKLLNEIDKLPAIPVTDPEPVSLHVNGSMSSEGM